MIFLNRWLIKFLEDCVLYNKYIGVNTRHVPYKPTITSSENNLVPMYNQSKVSKFGDSKVKFPNTSANLLLIAVKHLIYLVYSKKPEQEK